MSEDNGYNARIKHLEERVLWLERLYPEARVQGAHLKSQAAQQASQQNTTASEPTYGLYGVGTNDARGLAPGNLYAPLRNDTKAVLDLAAFARRLLDPHDLAHAVTFEVRQCARRALGLPEAKGAMDEAIRN